MVAGPLSWILLATGVILAVPAVTTRLTFLASSRLGWIFYLANIVSDTLVKRAGLPRGLVGNAMLVACIPAFVVGAGIERGMAIGTGVLLVVILLELRLCRKEREIFVTAHARPDGRRDGCPSEQSSPTAFGAVPSPGVHPDLVLSLSGPFVRRMPDYDLGDLVVGRAIEMALLVGNHSTTPCQVPVRVDCSAAEGHALEVSASFGKEIAPLRSGDVFEGKVTIRATAACGSTQVRISVSHADRMRTVTVLVRRILPPDAARIAGGSVTRYAGARRAAFAWRGDMDLYDTASFQSMAGLEKALGLAARYRFPQTMFLSARLALDLEAAREFSLHFGVDRGYEEIPAFIAWLREKVDVRHDISYPFVSEKPYAMEIGNHMYLHYGTDAAADPGNGWRLQAGIGAGKYPWQGEDKGSFAEQRDNALEAKRLMELHLGFTPRSWAMPDSTKDGNTPAAAEAAGCDVLSDSDADHRHNVLEQPLPHVPAGTAAVEITKRYPGDPEDITHASMILFWIHRAHRKGMPVVFMCHQHMRMFAGSACASFTEHVLRRVLVGFNGDLHVSTVHGIGVYWRDVLNPVTRKVSLESKDGALAVSNSCDRAIFGIPVDIELAAGGRCTVLVDLPPHSTRTIGPDCMVGEASP